MTALRASKIWSSPELLPRFVSLAKCAVTEAETLGALLSSETNRESLAQGAKRIEHEADKIVHQIVRELAVTYNSPFDREDLHHLASSLDDVIDFSFGAADRVILYKIDMIPRAASELCNVIQCQADEMLAAVSSLRYRDKALQHCTAVNQLEHDADQILSQALAELFESERDAIRLIKIKELYKQLASATDRAKDAAQAIETMVMKRGLA
jgi:predicted phosphate transport protein (TIGR00153 family)